MRFLSRTTFVILPLLLATPAAAQSFPDVPTSHPAYQAIEALKAAGVLQGYPDGTFKPGNKVARAEAVKLIVSAATNQLASPEGMYSDVPDDVWYAPYVETARAQLQIIDGPPKTTTFGGTRPVKKAEFLKMFLIAKGVDPAGSFADIDMPLATDSPTTTEWFHPYMRYAVASSMTMVGADGMLAPGYELTRADIAQLMFRYEMYKAGRRTQALLSEAENEIINVLKMIEAGDVAQAEYASARSLVAARGALASKPDETIVKGAVKTAEAFRVLVSAYRAGTEGRLDDVIRLSGEAWNLAEKTKQFDSRLSEVATQIQTSAKTMADEARRLKGAQ